MISRETRRYRACLKKLHTIKCTRHKVPRCHHFDCIKAIKEIVYSGKKRKASKALAPTVNVEELFRKLRAPVYHDDFSDDFSNEAEPVVPAPLPAVPAPSSDPTWNLTLRQRIELAKNAA